MAERKYIDAEALNSAIREAVHMYPSTFYNGLETARKIAYDFPAADVRPVVKARWRYKTMTVPGGKGQTYAKWCCTACKGKAKERTNYCPNCGAMMEER